MTPEEYSQNLIQAHIYCKAAIEHLLVLDGFKTRLPYETKDIISYTLPRLQNFTKKIDTILLESEKFTKENHQQMEEAMFTIMESLDNIIKNPNA